MRKAVAALEKRVENVKQRRGEVISDETRAEVEALVREIDERDNSPEERKKRRAWYEKLQEIGRLRREAYYRGEDMDAVAPLPWTAREGDADESANAP